MGVVARPDPDLVAAGRRLTSCPKTEAPVCFRDIPLRKYDEPEEFGRVAAFLLSPAASYITAHRSCPNPPDARAVRDEEDDEEYGGGGFRHDRQRDRHPIAVLDEAEQAGRLGNEQPGEREDS